MHSLIWDPLFQSNSYALLFFLHHYYQTPCLAVDIIGLWCRGNWWGWTSYDTMTKNHRLNWWWRKSTFTCSSSSKHCARRKVEVAFIWVAMVKSSKWLVWRHAIRIEVSWKLRLEWLAELWWKIRCELWSWVSWNGLVASVFLLIGWGIWWSETRWFIHGIV